ncbi:MAG: T9SS type A sorting domain-containing protein, partial [Ichthyobacteriaceae bacterium]|nr:T9SS type A sorting domain-containing protein [Ichthyobacteriaceae bacterium]
PRFEVKDKQWPANHGDADVSLWKNDKLSAFTVTIDDNPVVDIPFWKNMQEEFDFGFTWFVITEAEDKYNVKDWATFVELQALGNEVQGHDDRNWYSTTAIPDGESNPTDADYLARLQATQNKINAEITKGKCLTYAYPFGEGNDAEARKQFISIRGTKGVLNNANTVNYLNVNSVSSPHIVKAPQTYLPALLNKTSTLYNSNYYRGWGSTHFHSLHTQADKDGAKALLQELKNADFWVGGYTSVAMYSQSYATHKLNVTDVKSSEIKFNLTDEMLNSVYNQALTVKLRVSNTWVNVSATQNGKSIDADMISHEGSNYVLVNAVPDAGEVVVKGIEDADPAIITPIENKEMQEETTLKVGFSAKNTANSDISFSVQNLPDFGVFKDNGDNTGTLEFSPELYRAGLYNITVVANNGVSDAVESFNLNVIADASIQTIVASKLDGAVYSPLFSYVDPNNRDNIIAGGSYTKTGEQMSAVFPFLLPEAPEGMVVIEAKFSVNIETNASSDTGKLNLFGLDAREKGNTLVTDGYAGDFTGDDNSFVIQEDFANKTTALGIQNTSSAGELNLVKYLNNQYKELAEGKFALLRLSTNDVNNSQYARTTITSADGAEKNGTPAPTLIIRFGKKGGLSTDDIENSNINIYPNPVTDGSVSIHSDNINQGQIINAYIYSTSGKLVYSAENLKYNHGLTLNLDTKISEGVYFLKIKTGDLYFTKSIIIE